ncbi:MAG: exodeoxyribonuclease III, partial [Proteobacteria bacterium]|nr:exodeoxyribonuclease III [Pseudomonadota bacterium]
MGFPAARQRVYNPRMRIATWNINSVRIRLPLLKKFID